MNVNVYIIIIIIAELTIEAKMNTKSVKQVYRIWKIAVTR